ncbi:MAG: LacI family DNA-binding transcriptional regulator, partial [Chloroflexus sp.]|nr:LacI family DNA-binding transcriptional regulator [Chloroflexus sp.]
MYDVARLAGVSQTTVSFVVNNVTSACLLYTS